MRGASLDFREAVSTASTGDVWLFRGRTIADRAIQAVTNSPVNHVGMVVALDDLPPLLWHAELGRSLPDVWTGERQRGVQLHLLADAVRVWGRRYGQRAWTRRLEGEITREHEDRLMETIERFDGRPFPTTPGLARSWLTGRFRRRESSREAIYCAELVATTYQHMGLLPKRRPASWYDPGRFWSGDRIELVPPFALSGELYVRDLDDVLIGGREKRAIVIADHDPAWAARYEAERAKILGAIGPAVRRIEHIGSTSVPGLAAKPIVDILVAVDDPDDESAFVPALEAAGYVLRVREPGHRMLRTPELDVHVHVWRDGSAEVARDLAFRDRLRASASDREAYERLKRSLAQREWDDMNDYAAAKGALIEEITRRA